MPRYSELISKPQNFQERFAHRQDLLRRIEAATQRPVIVYAANTNLSNIPNALDNSDITPISDLTRTIKGRAVDIVLHSPGGLAEAAERIVNLLRSRFDSVRFVIPHTAFSAATMLAASADELVLDDTSALGPIDPQILFRDQQTGMATAVPTQAILEAFENAKADIKADPEVLGVYLPLLNKLDLALFEVCKNANKLAESLVCEWLKNYLLRDETDPETRSKEVTEYLSRHKERLSHGRPITLQTIKDVLKIKHILDLRQHQALRDLVAELWAEVEWYVEVSGTSKLFENAYGVAFRRTIQVQQQIMAMPFPFPFPPPITPQPQPGPPGVPPSGSAVPKPQAR